MSDPYRMVFVNLFIACFVLIAITIYHFTNPKKKINFRFLLFILSLFPVISIFRVGDYESGDFNSHLYRAIEFYSLLQEGNVSPSWAENLNATYGYPLFIFLNPLPYYAQAFFHALGFPFIISLKLVLAVSFVLSGIFFYLWAKKEIKNDLAAFAGAILYLFTPYHLVDLHFRVALGETVFFACLPLFFYCFAKYKEEKNLLWIMIASLSFSLLLFAHQAMAIFSLLIIVPYILFSVFSSPQRREFFISSIIILLLGFGYATYSWYPHILYPPYTLAYQLTNQTVSFPAIQELFYSPWRYGFLFQGPKGEIGYLIGYTQILLLLGSITLLISKNIPRSFAKPLTLWTIIAVLLILMMTPMASFLWNTLPILNTAQFATRLLLVLTFVLATIGMYLTIRFKKYPYVISIFLIITIGYTILNWGHRRVIPEITEEKILRNLPYSTVQGEGFCCMGEPKWTLSDTRWKKDIPAKHVKIIKGEGKIKGLNRKSTKHTYLVYSEKGIQLQEYTWYFPGWKAAIDNQPTDIEITKGVNPGNMLITVPPGLHQVTIVYTDLPKFLFAKIISFSLLFLSICFIFFLSLKKYLKR